MPAGQQSKEERKLPIVSGIPIAIESFPGNTLDHLTLRSALEKNIDGLEFSHFFLIGDRGSAATRICSI